MNQITVIYFARHAKPDYRHPHDPTRPLSAKGKRDAEGLATFFMDKSIDRVLSSPYTRTLETVRPFAERAGLEIEVIDGFRERTIAKEWIEDFIGFAKRQWEDFSYKLEDGECLAEVEERNVKALRDVLSRHEGETLLIGCHGTALSTLFHYYDSSYDYEAFAKMKSIMPWIVRCTFEQIALVKTEVLDIPMELTFEGTLKKLGMVKPNMAYFAKTYGCEYIHVDTFGICIQGYSDQLWTYVYMEEEDPEKLKSILSNMPHWPTHFATVEDWMLPVITKDHEEKWRLSTLAFELSESNALAMVKAHEDNEEDEEIRKPDLGEFIENLSREDADWIFEQYDYQAYTSVDYIRERIEKDVALGIRVDGQWAGWVMRHDDGAIGLLHVKPDYRKHGYGKGLIQAICYEILKQGDSCYMNIESDNRASIQLAKSCGFVETKAVHWLQIQ